MSSFGHFYLDREKDIIVELSLDGGRMCYVLRTPNHHSGNLITNFARLCGVPLSEDENGLKIIEGEVPCYITGENQPVYVLRFGGTKVANIYPDGTIERKAAVPAIAKTLMSQTKDYKLDLFRTLVKTYIRRDCKFRTDLHSHMNAILDPDILIALGICHQIRYPLYYVKKLSLGCSREQEEKLLRDREKTAAKMADCGLTGKYLDRKIDDNVFLNFADLILKDPQDALSNIAKIRASLAILKDGQAVFSNLEKVYLYRYVFTRGETAKELLTREQLEAGIGLLPDRDIADYAKRMLRDREDAAYAAHSLFQNKLLWIARSYQACGISYAEISDTQLAKPEAAPERLAEIHEAMPKIYEETGVRLRFLAGIRRAPLTIVRDDIAPNGYLAENLRTVRAIASDPYLAGSDILGEEINDIEELRPLVEKLTELACEVPGFVIRIHAGECDSLRNNVEGALRCVQEALPPGRLMPPLRIGHGLYTANLRSARGRRLLKDLKESGTVLEFQLSSNVRLNNLSRIDDHPLKKYLAAGVACVQGTDGGALYGTNSIDEELALERLLELTPEDLRKMCRTEVGIIEAAERTFRGRMAEFQEEIEAGEVRSFYERKLRETVPMPELKEEKGMLLPAEDVLRGRVLPLPSEKLPVIVAGGSFHTGQHRTLLREDEKRLLDRLLTEGDPDKIFFVIGHRLTAYEKYLTDRNAGRFGIFAIVPALISQQEAKRLKAAGVGIRLSVEPNELGLYKSFAYEIFKRRPSVLIALDGNAAGANLIQEAKNGRFRSRIYVSAHVRTLKAKTQTLEGYAKIITDPEKTAEEILEYCDHYIGKRFRS